jgi:hypothetical protein
MKGSGVADSRERARVLSAVPLQNAVLCVECDVVSDSPHDRCMVCGSASLFNVARIFGGILPKRRASLITQQPAAVPSEIVLVFPKPHRPRRRTTGSGPFSVVALDDNSTQPDHGLLVAPQGD